MQQTLKSLDPAVLAKMPLTLSGNPAHKVVDQCVGCAHVQDIGETKFCKAYADPASKWQFGSCNLGTHVVRKLGGEVKKVNPLKASKKAMKGK
jgi:hypothetical protein